MNYTKTVRDYCLKNKDSLFDVSYMAEQYFDMIPYKSLLKIMNRLEEEGVVTSVSKGVYYVCGEKEFDFDKAIFDYYIDNKHGMYVGYKLFNDLGASFYEGYKTIEIYTNRIGAAHKNIGNYSLVKVPLLFTEDIKNIVTALELIDHVANMKDRNLIVYYETRENYIKKTRSDWAVRQVIKNIHYKYSTLVTYAEKLHELGYSRDFLSEYKGIALD